MELIKVVEETILNSLFKNQKGFSLVELLMVIIVVGVMATMTLSTVGGNKDAQRYELTMRKMEAIRVAAIGDQSLDKQGRRANFGYVGDWGSLPTSLTNLTTAQTPAWSYNSTYGFGAGWKGPYVSTQFTGETPVTQDAWGNNFVWTPGGSPPSLTSYGADGAAGGTVYDKDIVMNFPTNLWRGNVYGYVADRMARMAGETVELRSPVNGVITASTDTSGSDGDFSFTSVPFGPRSLEVTTGTTLGPVQITVDKSEYDVAMDTLDYGVTGGNPEAGAEDNFIVYQWGTATTQGSSTDVHAKLRSYYDADQTLDTIEVNWVPAPAAYLERIIINGVTEDLPNPCQQSGTEYTIGATMTVPQNSSNNTIELRFVDITNCSTTGTSDLKNNDFRLVMKWDSGKIDIVDFATDYE